MNGEIPEKLDLVVRALSRDKTDEEVDTLLHDEVLLPAEAAGVMGAGARGAAVRAVGSSRDGNTPHASSSSCVDENRELRYFICSAAMISWKRPHAFKGAKSFAKLVAWLRGYKGLSFCSRHPTAPNRDAGRGLDELAPFAAVMLHRAIEASLAMGDLRIAPYGAEDGDRHPAFQEWPLEPALAAIEDIFGSRTWVDHAQCAKFVAKLLTVLTGADEEYREKTSVGTAPMPQKPEIWEVSPSTLYRDASVVSQGRSLFMQRLKQYISGKRPGDFTSLAFRFLTLATHFSEGRAYVSTTLESLLAWTGSTIKGRAEELLAHLLFHTRTTDPFDMQAVQSMLSRGIRNRSSTPGVIPAAQNSVLHTILCRRREYARLAIRHFAADLSQISKANLECLEQVVKSMLDDDNGRETILAEYLLELAAASDEKRAEIRGFIRQLSNSQYAIFRSIDVFRLSELILDHETIDIESMTSGNKKAFLAQVIDIVTMLEIIAVQQGRLWEKNSFEYTSERKSQLFAKHIEWCQTTLAEAIPSIPESNFAAVIRRLLYLEKTENYFIQNDRIGDSENAALASFRRTSIPEVVFIRIVLMGLPATNVPLQPDSALYILEELLRKVEPSDDGALVRINSPEIFEAIVKLTAFNSDPDLDDESQDLLAQDSLYWRAWIVVAVTAIWGSDDVKMVCSSKPRCTLIWEMLATGSKQYPPAPSSETEALAVRETSALKAAENDQYIEQMRENLGEGFLPDYSLILWDAVGSIAKPTADVVRRLDELNARLDLGRTIRSMKSPDIMSSITARQSLPAAWDEWLERLLQDDVGVLEHIPITWNWQILFELDRPAASSDFAPQIKSLQRILRKHIGPASLADDHSQHEGQLGFLNMIKRVASSSRVVRTRAHHCLHGLLALDPDSRKETWVEDLKRRILAGRGNSNFTSEVVRIFVEALKHATNIGTVASFLSFILEHGPQYPAANSATVQVAHFITDRPLQLTKFVGFHGDELDFVKLLISILAEAVTFEASAIPTPTRIYPAIVFLLYNIRFGGHEWDAMGGSAVPVEASRRATTLQDELRPPVALYKWCQDWRRDRMDGSVLSVELSRAETFLFGCAGNPVAYSSIFRSSRRMLVLMLESRKLFRLCVEQHVERGTDGDAHPLSKLFLQAMEALENDVHIRPQRLLRAALESQSPSAEGIGGDVRMGASEKEGKVGRDIGRYRGTLRKKHKSTAVTDEAGSPTNASADAIWKEVDHFTDRSSRGTQQVEQQERMRLCRLRLRLACMASCSDVQTSTAMIGSQNKIIGAVRVVAGEGHQGHASGTSNDRLDSLIHALHSIRHFFDHFAAGERRDSPGKGPDRNTGIRSLLKWIRIAHGIIIRRSKSMRAKPDALYPTPSYHTSAEFVVLSALTASYGRAQAAGGLRRDEDSVCIHELIRLLNRPDDMWEDSTPSTVAIYAEALCTTDPEFCSEASHGLLVELQSRLRGTTDDVSDNARHALCVLRYLLSHAAFKSGWRTRTRILDALLRLNVRDDLWTYAALVLDFMTCLVWHPCGGAGGHQSGDWSDEYSILPVDETLLQPVMRMVITEMNGGVRIGSRIRMLLSLFGRREIQESLLNLQCENRKSRSIAALEVLGSALYTCGVATAGRISQRRIEACDLVIDAGVCATKGKSVPVVFGRVDLMLSSAVRTVAGLGSGTELSNGLQNKSIHEARSYAALFVCLSVARANPRAVLNHLDGAADVLKMSASAGSFASQRSIESFAGGVANIALIVDAFASATEAVGWQPSIDRTTKTIFACALQLPKHSSTYLAKPLDNLATSIQRMTVRLDSTQGTTFCEAPCGLRWPVDLPLDDVIDRFKDSKSLGVLRATIESRKRCGRQWLNGRDARSEEQISGKVTEEVGVSKSMSSLEALGRSRVLFAGGCSDGRRTFNANVDVQAIEENLKIVAENSTSLMSSSGSAFDEHLLCSLLIDFTRCEVKSLRPLSWRILRAILLHRPNGAQGMTGGQDVAFMIGEGLVAALEGSSGVARAALDVCSSIITMIPTHARDVVTCLMRLREYSVLTSIATTGAGYA